MDLGKNNVHFAIPLVKVTGLLGVSLLLTLVLCMSHEEKVLFGVSFFLGVVVHNGNIGAHH